jgi:hypothetical protein
MTSENVLKHYSWTGRMAQAVQHLPSKREAYSSNRSISLPQREKIKTKHVFENDTNKCKH